MNIIAFLTNCPVYAERLVTWTAAIKKVGFISATSDSLSSFNWIEITKRKHTSFLRDLTYDFHESIRVLKVCSGKYGLGADGYLSLFSCEYNFYRKATVARKPKFLMNRFTFHFEEHWFHSEFQLPSKWFHWSGGKYHKD